MLLLSEQDIRKSVTMKDMIEAVRKALIYVYTYVQYRWQQSSSHACLGNMCRTY